MFLFKQIPQHYTIIKKHFIFSIFAVAILTFAYLSSFQGSWHLDDEPNILTNTKLHLNEFKLANVLDAITANPSSPQRNKLYRPIPCLSLALNWYFSESEIFSYHIINFLLHLLTFLTLNKVCHLLLSHYFKEFTNENFIRTAAVTASLLWALAPIQTQAVTYIIQRMAIMAALFSILSIYAYLKGRTTEGKRFKWFLLSCIFFLLALGSKENTILLPASLFLIELSFFPKKTNRKQYVKIAAITILISIVGLFLIRIGLGLTPLNFLEGYGHRSFTFSERILTEPRIIINYLSQILVPLTTRLSIEHDITLSQSLFSPWITGPAILFILAICLFSLIYLKKYVFICFPLLFFSLNHIVESSIIPLELVFEHRNYLPSFFLFLPFGILFAEALHHKERFSPFLRKAIVICMSVFIIISAGATYSRNLVYATEGSLWQDALQKAPNSARAAHNLGRWYREQGQYQKALFFFNVSLSNIDKAASPDQTRSGALNGIASIEYLLGNYDQSLSTFSRCLEIDRTHESCLKNRTLAYIQSGKLNQALKDAELLTHSYPGNPEYIYLEALTSFKIGDYAQANRILSGIAGYTIQNPRISYLLGLTLLNLDAFPSCLFFINLAQKQDPNEISHYIARIIMQYHFSKNDLSTSIDSLLEKFSNIEINNGMENARNYYNNPVFYDIVLDQLNTTSAD